jgi:hypothetical protein
MEFEQAIRSSRTETRRNIRSLPMDGRSGHEISLNTPDFRAVRTQYSIMAL